MACPDGLFYAARRGENCSSIAARFNVAVSELKRANPGINCDKLDVGQPVCVPGVQPEICPDGRLYTVKRGESMWKIARSFDIPLSRLIAANPWIPNPELIYPNEQLCVPKGVVPPPPDCEGGLLYAVRRGETCYSIARKFGISLSKLEMANPGVDCDRLQIGELLCIPGVARELCPQGEYYTVRSGDTMFEIAREFGIPLSTLIVANPWIPNPDLIFPGEQLCIPGVIPPPKCRGGLLYGVRAGETLFSIARKFDVTVDELIDANPDVDPNKLQIGQILCIPGVADELCPDGMYYTVQPGDSIFSIANEFDIPVETLVDANPWIPNPSLIFPGEQLCIPEEIPPVPEECRGGLLYAVRPGETFFELAQRFDVTVQQLVDANPQADPNNLQVGQLVCVPGVADALCPKGYLYTVQRGDTFFSISQDTGVTVDKLVDANPWVPNPAVIYPGEQLCIPPH
jgi:LysM repeat protein